MARALAYLGRSFDRRWQFVHDFGSRRIDVAEFIVFCEGCGKDPAAAIQTMGRA